MLLIALTFAYITLTAINFGACVNSLFKTRAGDFATTAMLGLFGVAMLASAWAIFGRVNWEFHILLLLLNIVLFFVFKNAVIANYRLLRLEFSMLPSSLKLLFWCNLVLIVAKSAAAPYILDNESYYIQTVKWLNEHGIVTGLANLHIFLAQMSGWHIAQSAFSFSFLYPNFNDLSGYCLLLANLYAVFRLADYFKHKSRIALVMGLLPVANVFFLQFSGAPAADIPVFVLTFMALDVFFCHFEQRSRSSFTLLAILVLFALYIKVTVIAIALLPMFLLAANFRPLISKRLFFLGLAVLCLFLARNAITSGMPVFPLPYWFGFRPDYAIPENVASFFFSESRPYPFGLTQPQYDAMPFWRIFVKWLQLPKLHGFFNSVGIILAFASPVFIRKFQHTVPMWIAYATMIAQLALLLWLSPQYRFFMNFILFFGLFCASSLIRNRIAVITLLYLSVVAAAVTVFVPLRLDSVTDNKHARTTSEFKASQLLFPHSNSKSDTGFEKHRVGNLEYFSPTNNDFFWKTGDGPIPCVNEQQIQFFEQHFERVPQLRTEYIGDGFVSKISEQK